MPSKRSERAREGEREENKSSSFHHFHAVHCADNFFCINFVPLSVLLLPFKILISFYSWNPLFGRLLAVVTVSFEHWKCRFFVGLLFRSGIARSPLFSAPILYCFRNEIYNSLIPFFCYFIWFRFSCVCRFTSKWFYVCAYDNLFPLFSSLTKKKLFILWRTEHALFATVFRFNCIIFLSLPVHIGEFYGFSTLEFDGNGWKKCVYAVVWQSRGHFLRNFRREKELLGGKGVKLKDVEFRKWIKTLAFLRNIANSSFGSAIPVHQIKPCANASRFFPLQRIKFDTNLLFSKLSTSMPSDNCELYKFTKYSCNAGQSQEFISCFQAFFALWVCRWNHFYDTFHFTLSQIHRASPSLSM